MVRPLQPEGEFDAALNRLAFDEDTGGVASTIFVVGGQLKAVAQRVRGQEVTTNLIAL